jgi:methylglutaconyl-CoA hydratase
MSDSTERLVRATTVQGVCTVVLDSPHNRNALSRELLRQLLDALAGAVADPAVRVILLTHEGPAFCSGVDLAESAAARTPGELPAARLGELLAAVWSAPKPVLARVAGPARAGGLGLLAAADLAVCPIDTTFAFSEVRVGVVPAVISATVLPRLTSRVAAELLLTGEVFDGARAARIGLVTAAVPASELDATVDRYVEALLRAAPGAAAATKRLLARAAAADLETRLVELTELSVAHFGSAEAVEGMAARRERRDPAWTPRTG